LLQAHDTSPLKFAVVYDVIRLRRQHALHVVSDIAENDAKPLGRAISRAFGFESLDLQALEDGHGEPASLFIEDGAGGRTS